MIANVSPSSKMYDDTHNTLKYADRAKQIKSSVSPLSLFTSAKEVMFSPEFVCLSVCLSVSNITRKDLDGFG